MKNKLMAGFAIIAGLSLFAGTVQARDVSGALQFGYLTTERSDTDTNDDINQDPFSGTFAGGYVTTTLENGIKITGDARTETIFFGEVDSQENYNSGPLFAGSYGLHVGKDIGDFYLGVYAGGGKFDGYEGDTGRTYGLDFEYTLNEKIDIFAQAGMVEAIGSTDDNEFDGGNARVGLSNQFNDKLNVSLAYEFAESTKCFEDCPGASHEGGRIHLGDVEMAYALNDQIDLIAGYEYHKIIANEEDSADSTNFSLGVRVGFGESSERNNLMTPMGGFHAAGWMTSLD